MTSQDMFQIVKREDLTAALNGVLAANAHDKVFILADTNTSLLLPEEFRHFPLLSMKSGEEHKTLASAERIWEWLATGGATRRSIMVNFGGGMITDLGGFAASCFKRGIRHVNIATTLLGATDASIGGKTGVNLGGYKNEVGTFSMPLSTIIAPALFASLPQNEWLSGIGELAKTWHIADDDFRRIFDTFLQTGFSRDAVEETLGKALLFKQRIVEKDSYETGMRKCLNFGHTVGHALESHLLGRHESVAHGIAVAHGVLVELILSHMLVGMPSRYIYDYADNVLKPHFPALPITCEDYDDLEALMHHDKKNPDSSVITFTAITAPGNCRLDIAIGTDDLRAALDIARDMQ